MLAVLPQFDSMLGIYFAVVISCNDFDKILFYCAFERKVLFAIVLLCFVNVFSGELLCVVVLCVRSHIRKNPEVFEFFCDTFSQPGSI